MVIISVDTGEEGKEWKMARCPDGSLSFHSFPSSPVSTEISTMNSCDK